MDRLQAFVRELAKREREDVSRVSRLLFQDAPSEFREWWVRVQQELLREYPDADALALRGMLEHMHRETRLLGKWVLDRPVPGAAERIYEAMEARFREGAVAGFARELSQNILPLLLFVLQLEKGRPGGRLRQLAVEAMDLLQEGNPQAPFYQHWFLAARDVASALLPHLGAGQADQELIDRIVVTFHPYLSPLSLRHRRGDQLGMKAALDRYLARARQQDLEPAFCKAVVVFGRYAGMEHFLAACRNMERHRNLKPPLDPYLYENQLVYGNPLTWSVKLLRNIEPPGEEDAARASELAAVDPDVLVTACLFAPSWGALAEELLGWPGFGAMVRWLQRYGGPPPWSERYQGHQEEEDGGAIDREAALEAVAAMGEKRLKQLLRHRVAKGLYRDGVFYLKAILGENAADLEARFLKRQKQAVRALGLLPDEGDIPDRYLALRRFAKEARQFGARRQASEQTAAEAGLRNLAATAGYADLAQLEWAMEMQLAQEVEPSAQRWEIGGYTVWIQPDEKASLVVERDGRALKSVPPAVRQAPEYVEIREARQALVEQWDRVRRRLEFAMSVGERMEGPLFLVGLSIPAGRQITPALVLRCWLSGRTEPVEVLGGEALSGEAVDLSGAESVEVAHPLRLAEAGTLEAWQRRLVERGITQPFPQLFREFYRWRSAEAERGQSRRFAGRKVRVGTVVERLKRRGWQTGSEGDLGRRLPGRVYASMWFGDGAAYYPATEVLTVEGVYISAQADPVLFSEVMRDVDLATTAAAADKTAVPLSPEVRAARVAAVRAVEPDAVIEGDVARVGRREVSLATEEPERILALLMGRGNRK